MIPVPELQALPSRLARLCLDVERFCRHSLKMADGDTWLLAVSGGAEFTVISESGEQNAEIEALLKARAEAKKAKNFAEADRIRDELKAQGIEVTDIPNGAKWKKI